MLHVLIILLLTTSVGYTNIIFVPDDHETIQAGIGAAENGDTILVSLGVYNEFISFEGKAITVAGQYLISGDEDHIAETIIDGEGTNRSVVVFRSGEDSSSVLIGFMIRNGDTDYGGGIYCRGSSPTLRHLIVENNFADRSGGGIYCTESASPAIRYVTIRNNSTDLSGGGISLYNESDVNLENCLLAGNSASTYGGGMQCTRARMNMNRVVFTENESAHGGGLYLISSDVYVSSSTFIGNSATDHSGGIYGTAGSYLFLNHVLIQGNQAPGGGAIYATCHTVMDNVTIVENSAELFGGIRYSASSFTLMNSIVRDNEGMELQVVTGDVTVSYTNIQTGEDEVYGEEDDLVWGEGNIDEDPLFLDPENGDYHLEEDSPCIDAGHPDSLDIDWTRADMGAFPILNGAVLQGYVFDSLDEDMPISGANIFTSFEQQAITDLEGFFRIEFAHPGQFNLTASYPYFLDSIFIDLDIEPLDTLDVSIRLRHPVLELSEAELHANAQQGSEIDLPLTVVNQGNANIHFSARSFVSEGVGADPGMLRGYFPVGRVLDRGDGPVGNIYGGILANDLIYVSRSNNDGWFVETIDRELNWVGRFPLQGSRDTRINDHAWDGNLLWLVEGDSIYSYNVEGEILTRFPKPSRVRYICWDNDRELLWLAENGRTLWTYNPDNNDISEINDVPYFRYRGLAYWSDDPDNHPLYILDSNERIYKLNPQANDSVFVGEISPDFGGPCYGGFVTTEFDGYGSAVFLTLNQISVHDGGNRLDAYQLQPGITWLNFDPVENDTIPPFSEQDMIISLDATELDTGSQHGELRIGHNTGPDEVVVPITLIVGLNSITDPNAHTPVAFEIVAVYPNPFNSSTTIKYNVPQTGQVSISIYDVNGRLVSQFTDRVGKIGTHYRNIRGESLASGLYFVKLEMMGDFGSGTPALNPLHTEKILLLR